MNTNVASIGAEVTFASEQLVKQQFEVEVDWKKYDGQRVTGASKGVYLVWNGELRAVPNVDTYNNLFRNWDGIRNDEYLINNMPEGRPLSNGALLARGNFVKRIFLLTDGEKHPIWERSTFDQFNLSDGAVKDVAQLIIDYIPSGNELG